MLLLEWLESLEKRQKRSSEPQNAKGKGKARDDSEMDAADTVASQVPTPVWLHCSVGAEVGENEDEDEEHVQVRIQPIFSSVPRPIDALSQANSNKTLERLRPSCCSGLF